MPVSLLSNNPSSKQVNRAERFINASEQDITRLATRQYKIENAAADKKFAKKADIALLSIPGIAFISKLATSKKLGPAAKTGASWGLAFLAPLAVGGVNKVLTKNDKIKKFEDKHPTLTFFTEVAASVGGMLAGDRLLGTNKVQNFVSKNYTRIKDAATKIKNPIKPETMKKITDFTSKIKTPEFVKTAATKVTESGIYKTVTPKLAKVGKFALKHAPELAFAGIFTAIIANSVNRTRKYSAINNEIKDAQFNTAKDLANYYKEENESLKAEAK